MDARAALQDPARHALPAAFALVGLALLSGLLLALTYDAARAHATTAAMPGALRGVHAWATSLAIVALLLHLARAWLRGGEDIAPRAWLPAAGALALALASLWSGGVLAWDQQAWESWQHAGLAPRTRDPGAPFAALLAVHAAALPLALLACAWLLRPRPDVRVHAASIATALLLGLALPPALGPEPIAGIAVSKPDWPFLWLVPLQEALGGAGLLLGGLAPGALTVAVPWLRWPEGARRWTLLIGGVALLGLSVLGAL